MKSLTEAQEHVPESAQATQELDPNCMVSGEQSRPYQQQTEPEPMTPVEEPDADRGGSTEDGDQDNVKDPGEVPAEAQLEHLSGKQSENEIKEATIEGQNNKMDLNAPTGIKEVPQEHQHTYSLGGEVNTHNKMAKIKEEQEPADSNPILDNQVDRQDCDYNYDHNNEYQPEPAEYYQWQQHYDQDYYHHDQQVNHDNAYSNFNQEEETARTGLRFEKTGSSPEEKDASSMLRLTALHWRVPQVNEEWKEQQLEKVTTILNQIADLDVDVLGLVNHSNSSDFPALISNFLTRLGYASSPSSQAEGAVASVFYKVDKLTYEPYKVELEEEAGD